MSLESAGNCRFGYIFRRKLHFLCSINSVRNSARFTKQTLIFANDSHNFVFVIFQPWELQKGPQIILTNKELSKSRFYLREYRNISFFVSVHVYIHTCTLSNRPQTALKISQFLKANKFHTLLKIYLQNLFSLFFIPQFFLLTYYPIRWDLT